MKGTGAKRSVCPGSCVSIGVKFPVAPVESARMFPTSKYMFCSLALSRLVRILVLQHSRVDGMGKGKMEEWGEKREKRKEGGSLPD